METFNTIISTDIKNIYCDMIEEAPSTRSLNKIIEKVGMKKSKSKSQWKANQKSVLNLKENSSLKLDQS